MLDCEHLKNHYRLITVDLSRQNELDTDAKAIQQIEFSRQLKNIDGVNTNGTQYMFLLVFKKNNKK